MTDTATFDRIPVTNLSPDPAQVRKVQPTKAEEDGLRETVKALGVLEPLVVRPNPDQRVIPTVPTNDRSGWSSACPHLN